MKLVIDIDEDMYKDVIANNDVYVLSDVDWILLENAIANGTPLDDIKAEIDQKQYDFMADKDYCEGIRFGLMLAYQIIDKHTNGKENE